MSFSKKILDIAEKVRPVIVKVVPQSVLSRMKAKVIHSGAKDIESIKFEPFSKDEFPVGVNLIGDIRVDTGLGQSMRYVSNVLEHSDYNHLIYNYYVPPGYNMTDHSCDKWISDKIKYGINIFHINASEMPVGFMALGREFWDKHYNIGFWLWEMQEFPEEWMPSFNLVDELWVPSDYIADCLRKYTDKPIITMPYPVVAPYEESCDRDFFNLPKDKFMFLMMYDGGSGMARKNPLAVIESFKMAFGPERDDVCLVIKLKENSDKDIAYIKENMTGYSNVYFVDKNLSRTEVNSLMKIADVYVSLHRAEGFGLTCAESMVLGTPVIATNYSSNVEFMTDVSVRKTNGLDEDSLACLVDYKLIPLETDIPPYKKGYMWADADVKQASTFMRRLVDDKELYDIMKDNAFRFINTKLSMDKVKDIMNKRISEIMES